MYVIATVICPNSHFSVSAHVPFLNLLFEKIAYSNAYLRAKFGFDTAENEPCKVCPLSASPDPPGAAARAAARARPGRLRAKFRARTGLTSCKT